FAATIQQQQQQQVQQLQAVAATVARTATTTSAPQSQAPQPALLIGVDTTAHDKKTATTSGSVLATVGTSRKKNFHPDSRWSGLDEKLLFLAGPRLKILRRRICPKKIARHIALHPCRSSDFVTKHWPNLQGFFI
ncbi:unnamed protein product, partial [Wuchereria bancrofti]